MWLILAIGDTLIELGFGFISGVHVAPEILIRGTIEFIVVSVVLVAMIPFAVKVNHELGLPGGPLIAAKLNGEEQPYRWSRVLRDGVLWSVVARVALMIAVFVGVGWLLYFFPSFVPPIPAHQIHYAPVAMPSASWRVFRVVIFAVLAGVREEILFRLVLMAVFSWALMIAKTDVDRRPSRSQLWLATIMQAYCFGLVHLVPGSYRARGIVGVRGFAIRTLVLPQTWAGVFFGRLYLKRGLETSIVAHIFWDLI
jgi:hypothetical protein